MRFLFVRWCGDRRCCQEKLGPVAEYYIYSIDEFIDWWHEMITFIKVFGFSTLSLYALD